MLIRPERAELFALLSFLDSFASKKQYLIFFSARDITGKCEGECRDRVKEGEDERQEGINTEPYSSPSSDSPSWTKSRKEQPAVWGGRV